MAKSHEMSHAARILRIREMLDSKPYLTIKFLQEEFGVSRKTVYNDLDALMEANVPIYSEKGPSGEARWMLSSSAKKKTVTLASGQVMPLELARLALSFLEGTDLYDQISMIIDKLSEGATPITKKHIHDLSKKVAIVPYGPKSYLNKADVLNDILTGLVHDQLVDIRYRSAEGKLSKHTIEPLSLVLYREALYLIANSRTFRGLRFSFAIDRITSSNWRKGEHFTYPSDYSPSDQLQGAFGLISGEPEKVEVVFDAEQANYVCERRWHPTQKFEPLADGRIKMTMKVSASYDIFLWLVGHTGAFEVISPPALRQQVKAALKEASAQHRGRASV